MNIANTRLALAHMQQMQEAQFNFEVYLAAPLKKGESIDQKLYSKIIHSENSEKAYLDLQDTFQETGEVPCGSFRCFCGELWVTFAKTKDEQKMHPEQFACQFLDLNYTKCFHSPEFYGKDKYNEVTLEDIITFLETSLDLGHFPDPEEYSLSCL